MQSNLPAGCRYIDPQNPAIGYVMEQATSTITTVSLENITVTSETINKQGEIYWIKAGESFTFTAEMPLPDSSLVLMIEKVVQQTNVVNDHRVEVIIKNGVGTFTAALPESGNWIITQERVNSGLEQIGAPFRVAFKKVEFDAIQ
jgi:hypothetical protein